jgi:hypothetical protein
LYGSTGFGGAGGAALTGTGSATGFSEPSAFCAAIAAVLAFAFFFLLSLTNKYIMTTTGASKIIMLISPPNNPTRAEYIYNLLY